MAFMLAGKQAETGKHSSMQLGRLRRAAWQTGRQAFKQAGWKADTDRQADRIRHAVRERQAGRQAGRDREAGKDRQAEIGRQAGIETGRRRQQAGNQAETGRHECIQAVIQAERSRQAEGGRHASRHAGR
jgi:hypothetical protein